MDMKVANGLTVAQTLEPPVPATLPRDEAPWQLPVDIRSVSLALLAVLASLYTLYWAKAVFVPILLSLMASYALTPVVDVLERWRLPRVLASALLLLSIVSGVGWTGYRLSDDAAELIASLPEVAQKLRESIQKPAAKGVHPATTMENVQQAASELEKTAEVSPTGRRGVTRVQVERPKFDIQDHLWTGTIGLVTLIGQATMVLFLTFFLLASGSAFRRKMVRIAGPTFSEKKLTIQALDEITEQIQRYLLVQVFTSVLVGIATWLCFLSISVQHAAVWGLAAGILNFVPYIGSIVFTGASAAVGLMQFGNLESALLIAGISLILHTASGYVLTPWLTSRTSRMNAVTVFVGVLAWGWLWGVWGLVLGVPILMAVKAVCDRIDDLKPLGELLAS